jgi:hypothetical protein
VGCKKQTRTGKPITGHDSLEGRKKRLTENASRINIVSAPICNIAFFAPQGDDHRETLMRSAGKITAVSSFLLIAFLGCAPNHPTRIEPTPTQIIIGKVSTVAPTLSYLGQGYDLRPQFIHDARAFPNATRYTIQLNVDPSQSQVTGSEQIAYINHSGAPLADLDVRLFPNARAFGGKMSVFDLMVDGKLITPEPVSDGTALRLPLDEPLLPGKTAFLTMNFQVDVPGADSGGYAELALLNGVMALSNAFPFMPVHDQSGWRVETSPDYGDQLYGESAFFDVQISAPAGETIVASGTCENTAPGQWACEAGPMRDFYLVLSNRYAVVSQTVDGTTINSYYYSGQELQGKNVLRYAVQSFQTYSELFGAYPYKELDLAETPNRASGIEYPGVIAIADRIFGESNELEWVVAHEVAHQWWYGVVGNDQIKTPWMDESLAQYSTLMYFEKSAGENIAARLRESLFEQPYEQLKSQGRDQPIGLPVASYTAQNYTDVIYRKGPLYFDSLRQVVGDQKFIEILQQYYSDNRYSIATPQSWLAAVQKVSGDPQMGLYDLWVAGQTSP